MSDTKAEFAQGALFYPLLSMSRFEARTLFGCLLISSLAAHQGAAISEHTLHSFEVYISRRFNGSL